MQRISLYLYICVYLYKASQKYSLGPVIYDNYAKIAQFPCQKYADVAKKSHPISENIPFPRLRQALTDSLVAASLLDPPPHTVFFFTLPSLTLLQKEAATESFDKNNLYQRDSLFM